MVGRLITRRARPRRGHSPDAHHSTRAGAQSGAAHDMALLLTRAAFAAFAPPPPFGLPPWSPGMAPPIPGPVFSPAFNALLVLMAAGSLYLAYTLYWQCKKIHEGGIGEDNEMLTAVEPGSADWLRSVQISRGTRACKSCPVDLGGKLPKPKGSGAASRAAGGKRKKEKSAKAGGSRSHQQEAADDDEEEEPLAATQRAPKPKKTLRAGGARGDVTEMAEVRPRGRR